MTDEERKKRHRQACKVYRLKNQGKCQAYGAAYRAAHKKALPPLPDTKTCAHCLIDKPLNAFAKRGRVTRQRPSRGAHGVDKICLACRSHLRKPTLVAERQQRLEQLAAGIKTCSVCKITKPLCDFAKRRASDDGVSHSCRECANHRSVLWKKAHPKAHREWYERNKDHKRRYYAKWRSNHQEHTKAMYRNWAIANPDKVLANVRNRELAKLRATPKWADKDRMRAFYTEAVRLTRTTGIKHEVDHVVPIRSPFVCGFHAESNLQILTRSENKAKGNKLQEQDTYNPASTALTFRNAPNIAADFESSSLGSPTTGSMTGPMAGVAGAGIA